MGILKKIGKGIKKGERKYEKLKKETAEIRQFGGKVFDFIIPPPKKGGQAKIVRGKICPPCPCSKIKKSSPKYKKRW